jgi:hypothetical protein
MSITDLFITLMSVFVAVATVFAHRRAQRLNHPLPVSFYVMVLLIVAQGLLAPLRPWLGGRGESLRPVLLLAALAAAVWFVVDLRRLGPPRPRR